MTQTQGPTIAVQIVPQHGPVSPETAADDFIHASKEKLQQVSDVIRTSWSEMARDLAAMPNPPDEIAVEFGVDVGGEAGVPFITKGSVGANFKVSVTWRRSG